MARLILISHMVLTCNHTCPWTVIALLKRIGKSKVLPDNLLPLLRHAIKLLEDHGDNLLVQPAGDGAQQRIEYVRRLLQSCEGLDTAAAVRCPLSDEVISRLRAGKNPIAML